MVLVYNYMKVDEKLIKLIIDVNFLVQIYVVLIIIHQKIVEADVSVV